MRSFPRLSVAVIVLSAATHQAFAADRYILNQNQTGLTLPGVNPTQGYDEIRTSDGTTCRSSNGNAGAYADVGVVGGGDQESNGMNQGAVYGRLVMPLGKNGTRLDCRRLYDLEIERLQAEVRLLKAGLSPNQPRTASDNPAFQEGWNDASSDVTGSIARKPTPAPAADAKPDGVVVPERAAQTQPKTIRKRPAKISSAMPATAAPISADLIGELRAALP